MNREFRPLAQGRRLLWKSVLWLSLFCLLAGGAVFFRQMFSQGERRSAEDVSEAENPAAMEIRGLEIRQGEDGVELWRLEAVRAFMMQREGEIVTENPVLTCYYQADAVTVRSDYGDVDQKGNRAGFTGRVRVRSRENTLLTNKLIYDGAARGLLCPEPSQLESPGMRGEAGEMLLRLDDSVWLAQNGVTTDLETRRAPERRPSRLSPGMVNTNISSESMRYNADAREIAFSGHVKVTHPDFTLVSDLLRLFLYGNGAPGAAAPIADTGAVRSITAESGVVIRLSDGKVVNCAKASYETEREIFVLEGNPVLREGASQVRGDKMIFYLREDRHEVLGRVAVDIVSPGVLSGGRRGESTP